MADNMFGYDGDTNTDDGGSVNDEQGNVATDLTTGKEQNVVNGENAADLSEEKKSDDGVKTKTSDEADDADNDGGGEHQELVEGTQIQAEGKTYTVDDKGNLRDENGSVFKEADDVQEWLKSFETIDESSGDGISVEDLQKQIGVEIRDENGEPVQFDNSLEGITEYVKAVVDNSRQEHYTTAINTLYERYPILEDVINYYVANGNSLEGFNEVPDRTKINVDENNEEQQAAIIRVAWQEKGNKGNVDGYIQYLKNSGTLFVAAKEELEALQESDEELKKQIAEDAKKEEEQRLESQKQYWGNVKSVIDSRQIAGYTIPETIIVNRYGKRYAATPTDFFNYLYKVDNEGHSRYDYDLSKLTPETRMNDEILRAYLTFTGGSYSNLVDMAVNQKEVMKLRKKAIEQRNSSVRIIRPKNNDDKSRKGVNIDLGY